MVKRAIAIGSPSALSIERRQLVMRAGDDVVQTAPLEDISIIVVDTPETKTLIVSTNMRVYRTEKWP